MSETKRGPWHGARKEESRWGTSIPLVYTGYMIKVSLRTSNNQVREA